ncbi:MAG: hypothetical protein HDS08_05825 [Bacteroides sp.]|nr:hypothetical protein [Bacteroides sp.]MDE7449547.1 septum formation initiator family protein [Paramuribaculum sp.]
MFEAITSSPFIRWCRRYLKLNFLGTLAVIIFVLFFNDNSVVNSIEYAREIERLNIQIQQYNDTFQYYDNLNRSLLKDPETMERIVREQYHMQRPGEDVYLID